MPHEDNEEMEENEGESKPKKKKPPILLIIVILNVVIMIGLLVYLVLRMPSGNTPPPAPAEGGEVAPAAAGSASAEKSTESSKKKENAADVPLSELIYKFKTFIVNLNEISGTRYLKTVVEIEMSNVELKEEIEAKKPRLTDLVIDYLSSLSYADTQGMSGKEEIRESLRHRINQVLKKGRVKRVYFTEFVIQ